MRVLRWTFLVVVALYVAVCLGMFVAQRSFLYHPTPVDARQTAANTVDLAVGGAVVKVSVHEQAGQKAIIYFGGNAEDVGLSLPAFAQAFPNYAIYMPHYRGFGGSTGEPTEEALQADAKRLFDQVHSAHPDVTVVGRSLGTGVAVRLAAADDVRHLVLVTPYDSILNVAKGQYPWLPVGLLLKDRFEAARSAPAIRAKTVILVAGKDRVIPWERTQALYSAFAPGIATLKVVPEADHDSIISSSGYFQLMDIGP